jgi:hypothetical protein
MLLAFQNCPAKHQKSKIDREQLDTKLRHKFPEPPVASTFKKKLTASWRMKFRLLKSISISVSIAMLGLIFMAPLTSPAALSQQFHHLRGFGQLQ